MTPVELANLDPQLAYDINLAWRQDSEDGKPLLHLSKMIKMFEQEEPQTENITTQSDSATKYVEYLRNHRLGGESN